MFLFARAEDAVTDEQGAPSPPGMDSVAESYYAQYPDELANGTTASPGDQPVTVPGEVWLMAVKVTQPNPDTSTPEPVWFVYVWTMRDIPSWPSSTGYGGFLTAQSVAQALKDSGHDVELRHYSNFRVGYTADTVTLT